MTGRTLSHYEVLEKLGEGGMGEVYRASDTRLGRAVVIKVLRPGADPERRQRFYQEARAASALNHPNIVTVHDMQSVDGIDFIVMEYVLGQTLAELIGGKPLGVRRALRYAIQIADALATAHAAGIIHRDLKPANVMITIAGLVKILDFGLAKLTEPPSDTLTADHPVPVTREGSILGTVAYMSPEQAQGRRLDPRSDIFSFGAVFYEMITGRRPFQGDSNVSTLTAILRDDPKPITQSVRDLPPELERIVERCMRKGPDQRYSSMLEVRSALQEVELALDSAQLSAIRSPQLVSGKRVVWLLTMVVALSTMIAGVTLWRQRSEAASGRMPVLKRLTFDTGLTGLGSLSQDGKMIVYASDRSGEGNLDIYLQQVAGGEALRLTHDETDEYEPSFSPDGSRVVFHSGRDGGGIFSMPALGGEWRPIVRPGRNPSFSPDGQMIAYTVGPSGIGAAFMRGDCRLYVIPAIGGTPRPLAADFFGAADPVWLSDSRRLLFAGARDSEQQFDWWVVSLDDGAIHNTGALAALGAEHMIANGPMTVLPETRYQVIFSGGSGATLNLWQIGLDPRSWKVYGRPRRLTVGTAIEVLPSASTGGRVAFTSGSANVDLYVLPADADTGKVVGDLRQVTRSADFELFPWPSADGKRVAYLLNREGRLMEVTIRDIETGRNRVLTSSPAPKMYPILSPDGARLAFSVVDQGKRSTYIMPATGGPQEQLCDNCGLVREWSRDGRYLLLQAGRPATVALFDLEKKTSTTLLAHAHDAIYAPALSSDGKWIAFHKMANPYTRQVFVAPFRSDGSAIPETEWAAITDGAFMDRNAAWAAKGNILYYLSERDTFRCIWGQRLDPRTRRGVGKAFALQHFHQARLSLQNIEDAGAVGMHIIPQGFLFAMGEYTGNLWVANLSGR